METEIECTKCGWQGDESELLWVDDEGKSAKPGDKTPFRMCPECGAINAFEKCTG